MGQNHARIYSEMGLLGGVYDVYTESSKKIAAKFDTLAYSNLEGLLREVDALSICTPTSNHYDVAIEAIDEGKSILVEKPFTGNISKAIDLCDRAEEKGVTLASGFVERFNPVVSTARDTLASGRFGDLVSISTRRVSSYPSRIRDVGVIMDLAIHDIDVIRSIAGREISCVFALGGKKVNPDHDDNANILLEIEDGMVGMVEVNWLTPMKVREVSMTCSKGFVRIDYIDQTVEFSSSSFPIFDQSNMANIPMELDVHRLTLKKEEPLKRELEDFVHAAEISGRPESDGWDAVSNLAVCEASYRSQRERRRVEVERTPSIGTRRPQAEWLQQIAR